MTVLLMILFFLSTSEMAEAEVRCLGPKKHIKSTTLEFTASPCLKVEGVQLFKGDFSNAQFTGSHFLGGWWKQVLVKNINMSHTQLVALKIEQSDLSNSVFHESEFRGTRFVKSQLVAVQLNSATGRSCYFESVNFSQSDFSGADFKDCYFVNCKFSSIKLNSKTKLPNHVLSQKDLSWVYLE